MRNITTWFIGLIALVGLSVQAEILASYSFENTAVSTDANTNTTAGTFSVGTGVAGGFSYNAAGQSGKSAFFSNCGFYQTSESGARGAADYVSFDVSFASDDPVALSALSFYARIDAADGSGAPESYALYTSQDGFAAAVATGMIPETGSFELQSIDLSGVVGLHEIGDTEFRLYMWTANGFATSTERNFRMDTLVLEGSKALVLQPPPYYVSPQGSDTNSGTSANAPFQTFEKVLWNVALLPRPWSSNVVVNVMAGDYFLESPIQLAAAHSGDNGHKLVFRNHGALGSPVLIGGQQLDPGNWALHQDGIYYQDLLGVDRIDIIYENRRKARKARFPNYEYLPDFPVADGAYFTSGQVGITEPYMTAQSQDLSSSQLTDLNTDIQNQTDAYLVVWGYGQADWHKWVYPITHTVPGSGRIYVSEPNPTFGYGSKTDSNRYYVEGGLRYLDAAGEFYFDTTQRRLYYKPNGSTGDEVIYSTMNNIIKIDGASNISFEGLQFACSGVLPFTDSSYTWNDPDAAVSISNSTSIAIRDCHFKSTGQSAINLDASHDNVIENCLIQYLGQSGIKLFQSDGNTVSNCLIHDIGLRRVYCEGVAVHQSENNSISHMEIYNSARYGVTVRGKVNPETGADGRPTRDNTVTYIRMYDVNQDSGDTAGLHMAKINADVGPGFTNYFDQITITRSIAQTNITDDWAPTGVYLDHPQQVMNQSMKNIEVKDYDPRYPGYVAAQFNYLYGPEDRTSDRERQIMQNRPDNNNSSTKFNCSWQETFDDSFMEYSQIGLTDQFPQDYSSYTVTYDGNGNTGGAAPYDNDAYLYNTTVTVLGAGTLVRAGYDLVEWNTAAAGTGTGYDADDTFSISNDVILYAQWAFGAPEVSVRASDARASETGPDTGIWTITRVGDTSASLDVVFTLGGTAEMPADYVLSTASPVTIPAGQSTVTVRLTPVDDEVIEGGDETAILTINSVAAYTIGTAFDTIAITDNEPFTLTYDGNGNSGGSAPVDAGSPYAAGATVTMLGNTGALVKTGYSFGGWNTAADGGGIHFATNDTFTITGDFTLYAQWSATVAYWQFDSHSSAPGLSDSVGSYDLTDASGTFLSTSNAAVHPVPNPDVTTGFLGDPAANPDPGLEGASVLSPGADGQERLTVSSDPGDVFNLSGKSFTFEGWIQHNGTTPGGFGDMIGGTRIGIGGWGGYIMRLSSGGDLSGFFSDGLVSWGPTTSGTNYRGTDFIHFALVWQDGAGDNSTGRADLYINGVLEATASAPAGWSAATADANASDFGLGGRAYNGNNWDGRFDEFRFSAAALDPSQFLWAPETTYSQWIGGFGLAAADQDFEDDPDGDGLINGIEAFFGTNPGVGDDGAMLTQFGISGNTMSLRHPGSGNPLSDVTGSYQWSLDLVTWYDADGQDGDGSTTMTAATMANAPQGNTTTVTCTINGTIPDAAFFRLRVSTP